MSAVGREHAAPDTVAALRWPGLDERQRALLRARAEALARPAPGHGRAARGVEPYLRIRIGAADHYGVPFRAAEEVRPAGAIARVPGAPPVVRGAAHRRGEMLAVIDLEALFDVPARGASGHEHVVFVTGAGLTVGLLVAAVVDSGCFDPQALARPLPSTRRPAPEHVLGIHDRTVPILDLDALLGDEPFRSLRS